MAEQKKVKGSQKIQQISAIIQLPESFENGAKRSYTDSDSVAMPDWVHQAQFQESWKCQ